MLSRIASPTVYVSCAAGVFALLCMCGCPPGGIAPGYTWLTTLGRADFSEGAFSPSQAADGGYFLELTKNPGQEVWLGKLGPRGEDEWTKFVGTVAPVIGDFFHFSGVMGTADGTAFGAVVRFTPDDATLTIDEFAPDGEKVWSYQDEIGGASVVAIFGGSLIPILPTQDGGLLLLDQVLAQNEATVIGLRKLDANRQEHWRVPYLTLDFEQDMVIDSVFASQIITAAQRPDGTITLFSRTFFLGGDGETTFEFWDMDSEGNEIGFSTYTGTEPAHPSAFTGIRFAGDGGFVLDEYLTDDGQATVAHVAKLAADFSVQWLYKYDWEAESISDFDVRPNGGVVILLKRTGLTGDYSLLRVLDVNGVEEFSREYRLSDDTNLHSLLVLPDGYVLTGSVLQAQADSSKQGPRYDAVILRTDLNGNAVGVD